MGDIATMFGEYILFPSPYGDFGTLTKDISGKLFYAQWFQSPYGGFGTLTNLVRFVSIFRDSSFQSPYGDFGNGTRKKLPHKRRKQRCLSPLTGILVMERYWRKDIGEKPCLSLSPLTGILVMEPYYQISMKHLKNLSQSPYGDFGNGTLSLSTRSQTGLTGDFFKPTAFFAFLRDPGEK